VKLDTQLRDFDFAHIGEQARRFEAMGFDGVWTFESNHDPFLPLALAAQATQKVALGTNIAVAFARSPFATALAAWDLQRGSGGRFRLGLGTQVRAHVERRFSAPFDRPAERVKDCICCIRAIWDTFQTGAKPGYKGEFYQFTLINPFFNGGPIDYPAIPIYLAGVNPAMCRAAGEVADGFAVHPFHSVGYVRDVVRPQLDEGARLSGKTVDDIDLYAPVFAVSGETQAQTDAAVEEVRRQISFYASTPNYRQVLEYHGQGRLGEELSKMARRGDWEGMPAKISDQLVEQVSVVAKPGDLAQALRTRYAGLLGRVSLYFPIAADDPDSRWQAFTRVFHDAGG
jgi:probable F420-dependent oxidoreductase